MMLIDLSSQPSAHVVGAKAARLGWLIGRGWSVPSGVVVPFDVTDVLVDGAADPPGLRESLAAHLDPARRHVVRSSADAEDAGSRSFAGQFTSVTDVVGVEDVLAAVRVVAASARSEQVRAYAGAVGLEAMSLRVAVIVQEMVDAVASGVAFSRDPVTGADHVVVEAVTGPADRLLAEGATPQRWISTGDGTEQRPASPVLPSAVVRTVVQTTRGIAGASGEPVDVEWVWDGTDVHVVQWRPVTGLDRAPTVWSSRIARDMLPGLIPPLVWSVNVPVLSRVWAALLTDALGDLAMDPDDLVRAFGYRAYFNAGAFGAVFTSLGMPADALERMRDGTGRSAVRPSAAALARRAPRLGRFAATLARWEAHARSELVAVDGLRAVEESVAVTALSDAELLVRVDRLRDLLARAGRLNIVTPLLADAWASSVRRAARSAGLDPGSVDPGQDWEQVRAFDPANALARVDAEDSEAFDAALRRFGHLSDSPNDCSKPTWAEDPDVIRALAGSGDTDTVKRGSQALAREALLDASHRWSRLLLSRRWDRAARYRLLREEVGYGYARAYALFRPVFLEVGERLVRRGVLPERDAVFLLELDEVARALRGDLDGAAPLSASRRAEMAEAADLHWPETIVGDDPLPVRGRAGARVLTGVPTSQGRHTGPARVVVSLSHAGTITARDVLVLAAADVTWTPLLVRAGAVVTETGGMLSHASIVARELGLPCVASVEGATDIPEGTMVCVDGAAGEVMVLADTAEGRETASTEGGVRR
ncbi:MAG TPA: PEP/pyruvate-binding domain-containing protein [Dermatophilaceae bacterium]|nr:PEP/pyruvate-binding domain-containing protein [Dermatophilaceae bacterium]